MIVIGPYRFSQRDAERMLREALALVDEVTDGLPAGAVAAAPHRARVEAALAGLDAEGPAGREAALRVVWDEWRAAMDAVRATGAFGAPAVGTVTGLFLGGGGVPKAPVDAVEVGHGGVAGDRQANRRHHGSPSQALCLWSTESIDHFRAQGHPIAPGLAGENVSITALAWARVRPGVRLRLGDVLAEISGYATPCKKNARWFLDGRFRAMDRRTTIHSRVYATVLEPGTITLGAPVLLEPPGGC